MTAAEEQAQAILIRRREEIEALERIAAKAANITVDCGLNVLLEDVDSARRVECRGSAFGRRRRLLSLRGR